MQNEGNECNRHSPPRLSYTICCIHLKLLLKFLIIALKLHCLQHIYWMYQQLKCITGRYMYLGLHFAPTKKKVGTFFTSSHIDVLVWFPNYHWEIIMKRVSLGTLRYANMTSWSKMKLFIMLSWFTSRRLSSGKRVEFLEFNVACVRKLVTAKKRKKFHSISNIGVK